MAAEELAAEEQPTLWVLRPSSSEQDFLVHAKNFFSSFSFDGENKEDKDLETHRQDFVENTDWAAWLQTLRERLDANGKFSTIKFNDLPPQLSQRNTCIRLITGEGNVHNSHYDVDANKGSRLILAFRVSRGESYFTLQNVKKSTSGVRKKGDGSCRLKANPLSIVLMNKTLRSGIGKYNSHGRYTDNGTLCFVAIATFLHDPESVNGEIKQLGVWAMEKFPRTFQAVLTVSTFPLRGVNWLLSKNGDGFVVSKGMQDFIKARRELHQTRPQKGRPGAAAEGVNDISTTLQATSISEDESNSGVNDISTTLQATSISEDESNSVQDPGA